MSLKPGVKMSQTAVPSEEPRLPAKEPKKTYEEKAPTKTLWEIEYKTEIIREDRAKKRGTERKLEARNSFISNGLDMFECPPPRTENEVWLISPVWL